MTNTHRRGTVETRFATFAIWVDGDGRLVRFHLSAAGAAAVDRDALYDERPIADVRRQVEQYCAGEGMTFDIERALGHTYGFTARSFENEAEFKHKLFHNSSVPGTDRSWVRLRPADPCPLL
jgi:hypothetical protein